MKNLAGTGNDEQAIKELEEAGIQVFKYPESFRSTNECKLLVVGTIEPWLFERRWCYWSAKGPGINIEQAVPFNEKWGKEVRANGFAGGIEDLYDHFKGFAVTSYHIDTQEGLNEFTALLKEIIDDAETKRKQS